VEHVKDWAEKKYVRNYHSLGKLKIFICDKP